MQWGTRAGLAAAMALLLTLLLLAGWLLGPDPAIGRMAVSPATATRAQPGRLVAPQAPASATPPTAGLTALDAEVGMAEAVAACVEEGRHLLAQQASDPPAPTGLRGLRQALKRLAEQPDPEARAAALLLQSSDLGFALARCQDNDCREPLSQRRQATHAAASQLVLLSQSPGPPLVQAWAQAACLVGEQSGPPPMG